MNEPRKIKEEFAEQLYRWFPILDEDTTLGDFVDLGQELQAGYALQHQDEPELTLKEYCRLCLIHRNIIR